MLHLTEAYTITKVDIVQLSLNKTVSIRFHKKYFKVISHSLGFLHVDINA